MRDFITSPRFRANRFAAVFVFAALLTSGLGLGCAETGMSMDTPQPTVPWNQALATQAAGVFKQQVGSLYDEALKEPSFSGERTAYADLMNNLRELQEESSGLYQKLSDGKSRAQTQTNWERIRELSRDAREDASWQYVPEELANNAKTALSATDTLDAYYGTR